MAVKLITNYAKRLGLPGYSSHQFSVCVETELHDLNEIPEESARLYATLQQAVDIQMEQTGFVPPHGYGLGPESAAALQPINDHGTGPVQNHGHASNGSNGRGRVFNDWSCTDGQRGFILRLIEENGMAKDELETLAQTLFGTGVKALGKPQASHLIDELLERAGRRNSPARFTRMPSAEEVG